MKPFEAENYRDYLRQRIERMPNRGRGELGRLAKHLRLHTTTLSQIINGSRNLSLEHAVLACGYFGMPDLETRYFLLLVQLNQTSSPELERLLRMQMAELKSTSTELSQIISSGAVISEEQRALFYSNWYYSAIRVLCSIPQYRSPESIAEYLDLPRKLVNQVIDFLLSCELCVRVEGIISPGPKYTHLEAASPLAARHHANWRIKSMERHPKLTSDELSYSSTMTLSVADAQKIQEVLRDTVKSVNEIREPSNCEVAYFMNLDWLKL